MKTLHLLSIVTTLGLASAVYAQAQTSPNTTTEAGSSQQIADSTTQHLQDPVSSIRVADTGTRGSVTGTQALKLVGMKVQTASGDSLGQIKSVVVDMSVSVRPGQVSTAGTG